jgi:bacterioferritin-associated ferredoxin
MLVCHCHGVNDRQIRRAIVQGAASVSDVRSACGAGAGCGGCVQEVAELLGASESADHESGPTPAESTAPSV